MIFTRLLFYTNKYDQNSRIYSLLSVVPMDTRRFFGARPSLEVAFTLLTTESSRACVGMSDEAEQV